ncbi:MAG: hypothetical protein WCY06_05840 [Flavobacteriaceae bacterium]
MRKCIILSFSFVIILGCSIKKQKQEYWGDSFGKETEPFKYGATNNSWITAYKDAVFYSCIREGYKNDSIWFLMSKEDWFNPYDGIDFVDIDTAMIIGKKIIQDLPKETYFNSEEFFYEKDESKHKNYISATCLHYYTSRELDSIAKEAFKNEVKRKTKIYGKSYYPQ